MDYSLPGSCIHEVFQARILEWVAISFTRGSSWPGDWTHISLVSCIGRQILYHWATWEAQIMVKNKNNQPLLHLNSRAAVSGGQPYLSCPCDSFLNQSLFGEEIAGVVGSGIFGLPLLKSLSGSFSYFLSKFCLSLTLLPYHPSIISLSFLPTWSIT